MYRLFLADDEIIILRGLRKLLDWGELGIEIVGEAMNGKEAEERILALKPDLAILDIHMPLLSGLDILRTISERKLNTRVILLTGHEEFAYAREALRLGAGNYLVKPVRKEELLQAVRIVIGAIESDVSSKAAMERLRQLERNPYAQMESIQQDYPCFTALAIHIDGLDMLERDLERLVVFSIFRSIERRVSELRHGIAFSKQSLIYVVLNHPDADDAPMEEINRLRDYVFADTGKELYIGVGKTAREMNGVHLSIETARDALNYRFVKTDERIFRYEMSSEEVISYRGAEQIDQILAYMSANYAENITLDSMARMAHMNSTYLSTYFKKHTGMNFKDYLTKIRMEQAMALLRREDMKTFELAERVGFGDARYFSALFKKTYGMTPMELKMKKKL